MRRNLGPTEGTRRGAVEAASPEILIVLLLVATLAGLVDAIAGGGGLLTVPALLAAGLDPLPALATNKLQGSFGTFTASVNFWRRGEVSLPQMLPAVICTFGGAALGTLSVQALDNRILVTLVPALLVVFAVYFLLSPRVGDLDAQRRIGEWGFALTVGLGIGFYDGFFGPGTGSFFAFACVALLGYNLRRATAHTKILNFTSNLASLLVFLAGGEIVWLVGLSMGLGQALGAWVGSHLVLRHGAGLVRPALVLVSLAITGRLLWDNGFFQ